MLIVQDILISEDVISEQFVCNLNACKGACCREGDYGAPLDMEELPILEDIYERVKPFLTPEGCEAVEREGVFTFLEDTGEFATPLIDGGPCAYMTTDENGVAQCGIERAHNAGVIDFKKPVSCHLYPIRVKENRTSGFAALNYHRWDICSAACELGKKEQVPVYKFVKEALIRKYGRDFFEELDAAVEYLQK
jgi:hypothetical protein